MVRCIEHYFLKNFVRFIFYIFSVFYVKPILLLFFLGISCVKAIILILEEKIRFNLETACWFIL